MLLGSSWNPGAWTVPSAATAIGTPFEIDANPRYPYDPSRRPSTLNRASPFGVTT
jgi:hypothetical protein